VGRRRLAVVAALLAFGCAPAAAHDFWIQPDDWTPAPDTLQRVWLRVGDEVPGESYPRTPAHIQRFVLVGPDGTSEVEGQVGADPAGVAELDGAGLYLIGYESNASEAELDAAKFESYLRDEGLDDGLRRHAARPDGLAMVREAFSRCAKALLRVGDAPSAGYDRVLGFTLEIVPGADPYALAPGGELPVRVLYDGAPLAGVQVSARPADGSEHRIVARTDEEGRARLPLDRAGVWLVKSVHIIGDPPGRAAEWESFWASLGFELPAAKAAAR
jgi:uncharacterized GH25 family protein